MTKSPSPAEKLSAVDVTSACIASGSREEFIARIQKANAEWRAEVLKIQQYDVECATRLMQCGNYGQAASVCREWMAGRIESALTMQQRFLDLWREMAVSNENPRAEAASVEPTRK